MGAELHVTEAEVRSAAQMLILLEAFKPAGGVCFKCALTTETIVRDKDSD